MAEIYASVALINSYVIALIFLVGVIIACICAERGLAVSSSIASILMGALFLARNPGIREAIEDAPYLIVVIAVAYLLIGAAWSYFKWSRRVTRIRDQYLTAKDEFLKGKSLPEDFLQVGSEAKYPDQLDVYIEFATMLREREIIGEMQDEPIVKNIVAMAKPRVDRHKVAIITWMSYWPASALGYMLIDFVRDLFDKMYRHLRAAFQGVADNAFKNVA
jgi:K+-sensing histidine kinase KdpD